MESDRLTANVVRTWAETPDLLGAELEIPGAAERYTTPGQYLLFHPGADQPVPLAIASAPGDPIEILMGPAAQAALGLSEGRAVAVDPPQGRGFDIELARGKDVLLFAVGSGISAIRSVVEYIVQRRTDYGAVHLFCGASTEAAHAYGAREEPWSRMDVRITRSNSKPWVQDRFAEAQIDASNAVAFVCGMPAMVEGVRAALGAAGLPADRVLLNF